MKVIFLDIDGVLNWAGTEDRVGGFIGLDPERIARFNTLFDDHPDAKIVISSTWRMSGLFGVYEDFDGLKKLLADRGLKGEIIGHTPIKLSHVARGQEIRWWLDDQKTAPEQFVILDDDTEGMEGWKNAGEDYELEADLRPHHVITHWTGDPNRDGEEGGLQYRHIGMASSVLKGKRVCGVCFDQITDHPHYGNCLGCNGGFP